MHIVLLEDDTALQKAITKILQLHQHEVTPFSNSNELLTSSLHQIDLYLLDIYVDGINGLELLKILQERNSQAQVIMMSVASDLEHINKAYNLGSIDFLKKPFHLQELLHKITLLQPKTKNIQAHLSIKQEQHLTKKEKEFLELLYNKKPYVVTYEEIENTLYNENMMSLDALRALVRRIRTKLKIDVIENVSQEGYKFK